MSTHQYSSPHDWLEHFLDRLADANDLTGLLHECKQLASMLDADQIQDEYQTEMEKDGYFSDPEEEQEEE